MASIRISWGSTLLVFAILLVVLPGRAAAFGAGNIPSIAQIEGHNWRHGDIEDMLKTLAFLHGKKWTSMMVSRTYFGNWLRDYSQAVDVGSLKGVNAATIRILVWVLSFMAHGYATDEFEVTEERLGVYRPEEHIDNPLGYADGQDARKYDPRLRGPVDPRETEIDPRTGMKNYIANESGGWATSAGYLRFSFARCIHFGRVYTSGARGQSGKEADLCEALRCLGQALHCMEDFSAHSNYCELALIELGHHHVFPHCGTASQIHLRGRSVYPIVTGTFGAVDFLHSVLGEANDHFTQSEVDEVDIALKNSEKSSKISGGSATGQRGLFGSGSSSSGGQDFISLVGQLPDIGSGFASQAKNLQAASAAQEQENRARENQNVVPGMSPDFDPVKTAGRIYPILQFRDRIVKAISGVISKIPGLEKLLDHISETLTAFVLGLLAPFVRPIIKQVSKVLKTGSSGVIGASSKTQYEPWTKPQCSDPTHSMLSKDHFTNILNSCAGRVATTVLQYVVPRVIFAWENTGVPVDEVVNDVLRAFHHPAARDEGIQIQREMFETVRRWAQEPAHGRQIHFLSSESVKAGKNHILSGDTDQGPGHSHGPHGNVPGGGGGHSHGSLGAFQDAFGQLGHGKVAGSLWSHVQTRDMDAMTGRDGIASQDYTSNSPAPVRPPASPGYGYHNQGGGEPGGGYRPTPPPAGGVPPQPHPYPGYSQPSPYPPAAPPYGAAPYPGQQPPPPAPPGGYWPPGPPGPPQGYGAPAPPYGGQPGYQQPPYQQQPPPQQPWGQYPGQYPRY